MRGSARGSSEVELSFLRTKNPASVADKNMRISLKGHISCFSSSSLLNCFFPVDEGNEEREREREKEELMKKRERAEEGKKKGKIKNKNKKKEERGEKNSKGAVEEVSN